MRAFKYLFLLSIFSFSFINSSDLKPSNINVLLKKDMSEGLLEVRGPYYIFDPMDGSKIASGILEKRFIIRATATGIKWGQEFPGIEKLLIIPRSKDTSILLNGIQYDGAIAVYKVDGRLNVINQIAVEDYLKSYLTSEFKYPLEGEAMAAIAIAARTTAYCQIEKSKNSHWHIDGNSIKYVGSALVIPNSTIVKAIDQTKNLILVNTLKEKKSPFIALWTEHSAGVTAPFHSIFRKDLNGPREGVEVRHAAIDKKESRWSYSISKERFSRLIGVKNITDIELFQDQGSKRTYAIRIFDGKEYRDINFFSFQKIVGKKYLPSNYFSLTIQDNEILFSGFGVGHGVGLCIYSISAMAQNGDTADKILSKFFKNVSILNLSAKKQKD